MQLGWIDRNSDSWSAASLHDCTRSGIITDAIGDDTLIKWKNFGESDIESKRKTQRPHFTNIKMRAVVNENTTLRADNKHISGKWETRRKIR